MQASEKMFFFSVKELSVHETSCQRVSRRLPPSTPSRNDWTTGARIWNYKQRLLTFTTSLQVLQLAT